MNQSLRGLLWTTLLVAAATSAYAQGWALPSKTPETPVACTGCPGQDPSAKTVGYKAPIATFTGRFLDSSNTSEWFLPYRTARAKMVLVVPGLDRIYFRYGDGSVASYGLTRFFQRLEASEPLVFGFGVVPGDRGGKPELFLKWDEWFNPEVGGSKWKTFNIDGSTRLTWFDVDDKGYVYVASTIFGWGIVKDNMSTSGSLMSSIVQKFPNTNDDAKPGRIAVVKGSTKYYAIVQSIKQPLWDVTDRANPKLISTTAVQGIGYFAKNAAGDRIAMIDATAHLIIQSGDGLANSSAPLFSDSGYANVTSDGTNFYGLKSGATGFAIAVVVPSGANGYTVQGTYPLTNTLTEINNIHYGDGYIVLTGSDVSWDLRVFKVGANLVPTPVTINASPTNGSYFRSYYGAAPPGYVAPGYVNMLDGTVYRSQSGKTYLIVCAKGMGDVYELSGGDSITTTNDGPAGTINPSTPAASNSKTFYGDPVKFTAKSTSQSINTVVWNFGNPEAGLNKNTQQQSAINVATTFQYSSLAKTGLGTKNVTASNISDANIRGTTTANVEMPTARFGIAGSSKFLFTQPNASSPAPIVVGDSFVDASDGRVESHFASWAFDGGAATKAVPTTAMPVGQCGPHSLIFTTFYGPYLNSGGTLTTDGSNFVVDLGGNSTVAYRVRPFGAALELASSNATSITFQSISRITANTGLMTAAHTAGFTYKWELVNSSGIPIPPAAVTGIGTIVIPPFVVPKSALTGVQNARVRLTLSTVPFNGTACAGLESSVAVSAPLNVPDAKVTQSGDCQGAPCTFTATSLSGVDTVADNWTYKWEVVKSNNEADNNAFTASTTTSSTFTPTFIKTGSFNVRLTATNATGSKVVDTPVTINTAAAPCPHMTDSSFVLSFEGKTTHCNKFTSCTSGETVTFNADFPLQGGYDPSCGAHTYTWSFPGLAGQTTTTPTVDAVVTTSGTVTVVVGNGSESHTYSTTLTVGSSGGGGGGGGGGNQNPCGTMGTSNIFISFTGNQGCQPGAVCKNNETLSFSVSPSGYSFSCASHTFNWTFGDGGTAGGQTATHAYISSGSHTVTLQIINAWQTFTKQLTLTTGDSGGGGSCQTMSTNTIAIAYSATSGCTSNNPSVACKNGETVAFDVTSFTGYDFACSNHTFSWNFGDGGTAAGKSTSHTFTGSGSHNVSVTISNGGPQSFTRQLTMSTVPPGGGTCGTITPNISLYIDYHNPTNTCGPQSGSCTSGEQISFTVKDYVTYDSSCATHTYDWDFGDGTAHGSGKDVTHQYAAGGTYAVKCVVNNTSQTVTLTQSAIVSGSGGTPDVQVVVTTTPVPGLANAYSFAPAISGAPAGAFYVWDMGDGNTQTRSNANSFVYQYQQGGRYTVTVKVYSNATQSLLLKTQTFTVGTTKRRSVRH